MDLSQIHWQEEQASAPSADGPRPLTLEWGLQQQALRLLHQARPKQGAAVMLDATSGRVLTWAELKQASMPSLLFKASAPAASLFKIVTTVTLFERGGVQPKQRVCIDGGQHGIYRRHLQAATGEDATCAPFFSALGHSRNAAYAQLVNEHLMRQDLVDVADTLGFNRSLPFDTDVELGTLEVPYNDLAFARTAAGFTNSRLTPLGAAYLAFVIANQGQGAHLSIVDNSDVPRDALREPVQLIAVNSAWRLVRMMEVTVHSGTSLSAFSDERGQSYLRSIRVAGKTGTLQASKGAPTSSWFVGFAPSRKPKVVVSVLLQNGRVWHRKANEVARDLLRTYFHTRGFRGITPPI